MICELTLLAMCGTTTDRFRKAKREEDAKDYTAKVFIGWLGLLVLTFVLGSMNAPITLIVSVAIIGYGILFYIAALGMRAGKKYMKEYADQLGITVAELQESPKKQVIRALRAAGITLLVLVILLILLILILVGL